MVELIKKQSQMRFVSWFVHTILDHWNVLLFTAPRRPLCAAYMADMELVHSNVNYLAQIFQ